MKDIGQLLLRISFGGMMLTHGIPKLNKLINGDFGFADPIGLGETFTFILAVLAEFLCSILVVIGFKVKWTVLPLIATMAVAVFVVHADDAFKKKEFALLYLAGYIAIFLFNSGKYSLDSVLKSK